MGFCVDEVHVDFQIRFGDAEQKARRMNREMAKLGKVAGVAADAQDRVERSTRKAGRAAKGTTREVRRQEKATSKLATTAKRAIVTLLGFEVIRRVFVGLTRVLVKFETRMAEVSTIAGKTAGGIRRFSQEVYGRTNGVEADESRVCCEGADERGVHNGLRLRSDAEPTGDATGVHGRHSEPFGEFAVMLRRLRRVDEE